ncbi:MAG: hypothetical protein R3F11_21290 [Verrucomicrobiales bacterium]
MPGSENHQVTFSEGSISRCAAESGQGGGVFSGGTFSLAAASLYENTAATDGGGIFNINDATIRYASLYGNGAQRGGGVFNAGASSIEIANSTVAENFASTDGGGLYNAGSLRLISATVAFNQGRSRGRRHLQQRRGSSPYTPRWRRRTKRDRRLPICSDSSAPATAST